MDWFGSEKMLVLLFFDFFFHSLSAHPIKQSSDLDATSDLVFLQTVWRHGDRSPIWAAPNDPNQEATWPQGLGQLSTEGMQQHMNLGRKLRQRYAHFISPHYDSREVYVRSSDVNRTIMSAMANMIGFYGEGQDGVDYPLVEGWPRGFVPVPIHAVPEEFDYMRGMLKNCKRFQRILDMTEETPEFQRLEAENKETIERLYSVLGTRDVPLRQFGVVADTWRIERHYNRPQTPGFTEELYKQIEPIGFRVNGFKYGMGVQPMNGVNFAVELARSHGGLFLWAIIEHMQQKRACHEQAIGNKRYPPYAACVTIELRRDRQSGRYFVKRSLPFKLENIEEIYRHGDRAPNYVYKHNPNQAEAWPFGLGNLSPTGMYQQMQLGKKLRKRYGHLMSPGFASDEIYVRSSDFNRTLTSAMANLLYGLQPTPGMTPELFNGLSDLEIETTGFEFGRHLSRRNGVDYAREMAVSLGGGLLQEIVERMQQKIECLAKHPSLRTPAESQSCTWIDRLKLYEYSAVLYMKEDETVDLTDDISGCEQSCSFEQFVARSQPFLLKSRDEYCASNPGSY
ncbi:hypothetical protein M3Y99_01058800 [Aphelenchoides fujianensis]|nr:hypothetical protein M3Y99_01058800 [Aphelenchoides fujianensis]